MILEQYFKPYPVCRWAQPAVEAVLALRAEYEIDPSTIDTVEIATFHEAARLATAAPSTTEHAQYSLPFPTAAALVRGQLGATEVTAEALADRDILELAQRITIVEDAAHNEAFPGNRYGRATITLTDGRTLQSDDHEPRGDPEAHLSDTEIREKFHRFADPVLGSTRASAIEDAIDELTRVDTIETLTSLIYEQP